MDVLATIQAWFTGERHALDPTQQVLGTGHAELTALAAYAGPVAIADAAYAGRLHPGLAIHRRAWVSQARADGIAMQPMGVGR
jgi:hypothetical protein